MIGTARVLGLVAARGGSKSLPHKNVLPFGGKPLIQWTFEAARGSVYLDRLILSTDDEEIAAIGRAAGVDVPFLRPADLASDDATALDVITHALDSLHESFDVLVYLQPTSPLRTSDDIDGCLTLLAESGAESCVSVTASPVKPEWLFRVNTDGWLTSVLSTRPPARRQELGPAFQLNGAVYAAWIDAFRRAGSFETDRTVAWIMPPERAVDIDTQQHFDEAQRLHSLART